jgi:hypothetical protein
MQRLEVICAVRPIYGSLGAKELRVPREGWDGIPVLIGVYGYKLVERSVRTGCVGRSEVLTSNIKIIAGV